MIQVGKIPMREQVQVRQKITNAMSQHFCSENPVGNYLLCRHLISGIFAQLGQLHPVVRQVVDHKNKGAHPMHLVAPAEGEKSEGGNVVNEHLPKVFALHVGELGEQEGPVKSHLEHVVPPNGWICKKYNMVQKRDWNNFGGPHILFVFRHHLSYLVDGMDSCTSSEMCCQPRVCPTEPRHQKEIEVDVKEGEFI